MKKLLNEISSKLAKLEAGKSQVKIGDYRQILALMKKLAKDDPELRIKLAQYLLSK